MNRYALLLFPLLMLACTGARAEASQATFERITRVAIAAFPPGTTSFELFLVTPDDRAASVRQLSSFLGAAKKQRARWVVASEDAELLHGVLMEVFARSRRSMRIQTQIVVVSPIPASVELQDAAREVGASLEFLVLPPAPAPTAGD
ncbi:hypothetical protein [Rehaibacterium terrae]|jgi:hypothetical protein|uniref:Uncharacterized protein n=1 Tax=Rehaibacterium terrae TaxID=1341696 RepID=A0A7W7XYQ2_9GAMM|nr:hypothetical protein [Rehaibacterium terrae]MBB5014876.1 hypothetical protein [Rehaibacterium terrae]